MIVDVHTHFLDFSADCAPQVAADMLRCGIDPASWQFSAEEHLRATQAADFAIVFGLRAVRTGWQIPNLAVARHVERAPERVDFLRRHRSRGSELSRRTALLP